MSRDSWGGGGPPPPQRLPGSDVPGIAPARLPPYVLGAASALAHPLRVAVIGTRNPDPAARRWTRDVVSELAGTLGACIVSGLARGTDAIAHAAALDAGGTTVAVLAHGLDTVYPPENASLAARIVASGGALVSQWPEGTPPLPWRFVARDRHLVALVHLVVAVQSAPDGGTMHAVREALRRSVPVCVPAEPADVGGGLAPLRASGQALACADAREVLARFARTSEATRQTRLF